VSNKFVRLVERIDSQMGVGAGRKGFAGTGFH
jgi:hypothetical protein